MTKKILKRVLNHRTLIFNLALIMSGLIFLFQNFAMGPGGVNTRNLNFSIDSNGYISLSEPISAQVFPADSRDRRRVKVMLQDSYRWKVVEADRATISSSSSLETVYNLSSTEAPGFVLPLRAIPSSNGIRFIFSKAIIDAGSPQLSIKAISLRFGASSLRCEGSNGRDGSVCGNAALSLASVCLVSNCNSANKVVTGTSMPVDSDSASGFAGDDLTNLGGTTYFGAEFVSDISRNLDNATLFIFASPNSYRSIVFKKALFSATAQDLSLTPEIYKSMIFAIFGPSGNSVDQARIDMVGASAQKLDFTQIMLLGNAWIKSAGGFDALPGFDNAMLSLKNRNLDVSLHHLQLGISLANPLYSANNLLYSNGQALYSQAYGGYFWDSTKIATSTAISDSYVKNLKPSLFNRLTIYQDGTEAYLPYLPLNLQMLATPSSQPISIQTSLYKDFSGLTAYRDHLNSLAKAIPGIHFQEALGGYRSSVIRQAPITDVFQVKNSKTPNTWAHAVAIPDIISGLKRGIVRQMGWVPFVPGSTDEDYGLMLNAAVALGAPLVIEATPEEFNLFSNQNPASQFKNRLWSLNLMTGERELVRDSAESVQVRFESGATSVGVFDNVTAGNSSSQISGRAYGVKPTADGYLAFDGLNNDPNTTYPSTKLTSEGSRIEIPANPALVLKNSFSVSIWFKMSIPAPGANQKIVSKKQGFEVYAVRPGSGPAYVAGYLLPGMGNSVSGVTFSGAFGTANGPVENQWNHLVYEYAGDHTSLFLNGALVATAGLPSNFRYSPDEAPIYLGRANSYQAQDNYVGALKGFKIYSKALSSVEVANEFTGSLPLLPELVVSLPLTSSLVSSQDILISGAGPFQVAALGAKAKISSFTVSGLVPGRGCLAIWNSDFGSRDPQYISQIGVTVDQFGRVRLPMQGYAFGNPVAQLKMVGCTP